MITILRNNQRVLMLVIAALTIIAFAFLYNPINSHGDRPDSVASIYGKHYSQTDIDREGNNYRLALAMGQFEMANDLGGMAQSQSGAESEFIVNLIVIRHQAEELGIEPTDEQLKKTFMSLPAFQTDGQYDPRKYSRLVETELGPHGFTEAQVQGVMRDALNLERIKAVITAPIAVGDSEIAEAARVFQKMDLQTVKFSLLDVEMAMNVTDEEVNGAYERNKGTLINPATRVVKYVEFALPPAQAALKDREKIDALQKVADAASAFAVKAVGDFDAAAQAAGLPIKTSPEFDQSGFTKSGAAAPDAQASEDIKGFAPAAFMLAEGKPVSDVVQAGDKFFVLKFVSEAPERQMALDEAKDQLVSRLKALKAQRSVQDSANASLAKIREAMKGGKSFADAAAAVGLKVETLNGFDPTDTKAGRDHTMLAQATQFMQPGQLSNLMGSSDGGVAVFLASRAALTPEELAKYRAEIEPEILANKQRFLFVTWLAAAREAADFKLTNRPAQGSGG